MTETGMDTQATSLMVGGVVGAACRWLSNAGLRGRWASLAALVVSVLFVFVYGYSAGNFARETAWPYLIMLVNVLGIAAGAWHGLEEAQKSGTGTGTGNGNGSGALFIALVLGALVSSSCALTIKNPTPVQQATAREQTADVVDRLTTALGLADGVTQSLTTSSLAPAVKTEIGCGILKVVGRDAPTPAVTRECGALPTRALSPFQKASDAAQALTTCASRQNTIAVLFDLVKPIWERLERSTDRALQIAGAALRLVLLPVQTTCGGVA